MVFISDCVDEDIEEEKEIDDNNYNNNGETFDIESNNNNNNDRQEEKQSLIEADEQQERYSPTPEIYMVKVTFEKKLDPSQSSLVEKILEGMMDNIHSFRFQNKMEQSDVFVDNHFNIDIEQQKGSSSLLSNDVLEIEYNPKDVSISKILESFHDLGLKHTLGTPTPKSTSQQQQQQQSRNDQEMTCLSSSSANKNNTSSRSSSSSTLTKPKCRSSFHVNGICCATEVPIVTSIIKSIPSKRQYIYRVSINIALRTVYVTYHPEFVTAMDILEELAQQGFENSTIEEDGNISYEKRKKKKTMMADVNHDKGQQQQKQHQQPQQQQQIPTNSNLEINSTNNMIDIEINNTSTTSTFVESVLLVPSLSEDAIETMIEIFFSRNFLHDSIRSYSGNIASKTIKIEHNPNLVSIQNVLDTLKMEEDDNKGNGTYFDDCSILVDGFREGLVLPCDSGHHNSDKMQYHHGDYEKEGDAISRPTLLSDISNVLSLKRCRQKSSRFFRACGIGTQDGLGIHIIISGIFWMLSIIGHFTNDKTLMLLGLIAVTFGLPPVAKKAFRTLRRKQFDANCMMVTAALGAVALGEYDEAASVSFLFAISEYLEDQATRKAKKAMDDIINLRPDHANYIDKGTGEIRIIPVNDLDIDDYVSVRMGDKIPTDGIVVEGFTQIDESSLTGESTPVNKTVGDAVSGGTINVGGTRLVIRATALVEDSAVSRLIQLVEESASSRSPTELLVDSFARSYTPTVIFIAVLLCTIPWFWGVQIGREWVLNGLIIVVIACPCALTISTPVTYAAGLAATAQKGIIVKGGARLEALGSVKRIVFDKTGTLTEGKFRLVDLQTIGNKKSRREILELLAIMEGPSSHPLAATLVNAAKDEGVNISNASIMDHSILKGEGVTAKINDQATYVGNVRLFKRLGMFNELLDEHKNLIIKWNNEGSTVGLIGIKGVGIIGMFCVADVVRLEAKEVVRTMIEDGIDVFMLTGDGEGPAKAVASEVGIPLQNTRSQFLPEDKLHYIASMLSSSKRGSLFKNNELLLMCGDGVNDAPALAVADVGVAMGEGAALALEISDVTLMDSNLTKLLFSMKTGSKVIATVQENIAFSVAAKIIVIILTFMGRMTLLGAIASDVGVMLLVSINGMKLLPGGPPGLCCKKRKKYGSIEVQEPMNDIV